MPPTKGFISIAPETSIASPSQMAELSFVMAGTMSMRIEKKVIKTIHRQAMFPAKTLSSEEEIDSYIEKIRTNMKQLLKGCDGIKLN